MKLFSPAKTPPYIDSPPVPFPVVTSKCHRQRPPSLHKAYTEFEHLLVVVNVVKVTDFVEMFKVVKMTG